MKLYSIFFLAILQVHFCTAQEIVSEAVNLSNGPIKIPGTLKYQKFKKDAPLVIYIPGSGNVDRNGNQAGANVNANYIRQLSDTIVANGIAFFSYDKRTATPENLKFNIKDARFEYLAEDVNIIIDHFKEDTRFEKIILIGHSQGSLVGMLVADERVDKYISLAGLSQTMEEAIVRQISAQNKDFGELAAAHFKELNETDTILKVNPFLAAIFNPLNHSFLKSYNAYNPVKEIKKVKIPTLIINGESDLQVRVEDAQALHAAKPDAELILIPDMNHVLKEVANLAENQRSYQNGDFPISPKLIEALIEFIKK